MRILLPLRARTFLLSRSILTHLFCMVRNKLKGFQRKPTGSRDPAYCCIEKMPVLPTLYMYSKTPPFFATVTCSRNTTPRSNCIASFGLLTARRVRHIRSSSSWRLASADHREPIVPHGGAEERLAFPRGEGEAPAMWILQQDTNVRLHLRGMERCGDWAPQERASTSNMSEAFWCNRLGGIRVQPWCRCC